MVLVHRILVHIVSLYLDENLSLKAIDPYLDK